MNKKPTIMTKTDAELVFFPDKVIKRYNANYVTNITLSKLFHLDKLLNTYPVFIREVSFEDSPFYQNSETNRTGLIVEMRKLNAEDEVLTKLLKNKDNHLVDAMGQFLAQAHRKTPQTNIPKHYIFDRFLMDLDLLKNLKIESETYVKALNVLEIKINNLDKEIENVVEGHGDLNLEHIYFEQGSFTLLDFSHKDKYRIDHVTRDIAGVVLHLIENGLDELVDVVIEGYKQTSTVKDFDDLLKIQLLKKAMLKSYIYSGGFSEEHIDISKKSTSIENLDKLLKKYI